MSLEKAKWTSRSLRRVWKYRNPIKNYDFYWGMYYRYPQTYLYHIILYLSICRSIYLPTWYLPIYLFIYIYVYTNYIIIYIYININIYIYQINMWTHPDPEICRVDPDPGSRNIFQALLQLAGLEMGQAAIGHHYGTFLTVFFPLEPRRFPESWTYPQSSQNFSPF